jgi:hypothetical protein
MALYWWMVVVSLCFLHPAHGKWYAQICPTGNVEAVTIDTATGRLTFVDWSVGVDQGSGESDTNTTRASTVPPTPPAVVIENENNSGETTIPAGNGNRFLRHSADSGSLLEHLVNFFRDPRPIDLSNHSATPAMRLVDFPLEERRRILQEMIVQDSSTTTIPNYHDGEVFYIRPCLCYNGSNRYSSSSSSSPDATTTTASTSTADELYLCNAEASYCGVPIDDTVLTTDQDTDGQFPQTPSPTSKPREAVACYSVNMQQVVARNAWPLILLWYFGLLVICVCTIHGHTAAEYGKSWLCPRYNERFLDRMLDPQQSRNRNRSWWSWQRHRFEDNLILQVQWIWRHEEYARERRRRQEGMPPPQLELRVKRWTNCNRIGDHANHGTEMSDAVTLELPPTSATPPPGSDESPAETVKTPQVEEEGNQLSEDGVDTTEDAHRGGEVRHLNDDSRSITSYDEPSCTICFAPLEEGDRIGDLPCNHEFHVDCLKTWVQRKNACPLCNVPIGKRTRPAPPAHGHAISDSNNSNNNQMETDEPVDDYTEYYRDRSGRRRRRRPFGQNSLSRLPLENRRIGMIGVTMDVEENRLVDEDADSNAGRS